MTTQGTMKVAVAMVAAAGLAACGGGTRSGGTGTVGPAGGTVIAQGVRVTVPPGALSSDTQIQVTEHPRREGEPRRIHIGPDDASLSAPVTIVVRSDDGNAADDRLVGIERRGELEIEHGLEVERHDEIEHGREAEVRHLGEFELRHARTCDTACDVGFECDDGMCKVHPEDAPGTVTSCPAGMELDASDGFCKPHGGNGGSGR